MTKSKIFLIILLLLVIGTGILFGLNYLEVREFEGASIKMHDIYHLDIVRMNKTDEHIMPVKAGDELAVDFDIQKGTADLTVTQGDTILYRGNKIDTASFRLPIEADGECRVEVKASHAQGSLTVAVKPGK